MHPFPVCAGLYDERVCARRNLIKIRPKDTTAPPGPQAPKTTLAPPPFPPPCPGCPCAAGWPAEFRIRPQTVKRRPTDRTRTSWCGFLVPFPPCCNPTRRAAIDTPPGCLVSTSHTLAHGCPLLSDCVTIALMIADARLKRKPYLGKFPR